MKILVLNSKTGYSLGDSYARAFKRLGHDVNQIDPRNELVRHPLWRNRISRRIAEPILLSYHNHKFLKTCTRLPMDVCWVGKGDWALPWFWRTLQNQRPDVKLVCYNPDNPITTYSRGGNRAWVTRSVPYFHLYCTYNGQLLKPLKDIGAKRVLHLPFAWDPELYPPCDPSASGKNDYDCDIVFIGNLDKYRERCLSVITDEAMQRGWDVTLYGTPESWARCRTRSLLSCYKGHALYGEKMGKAIRSAKVCLNILRLQNEGSHNMRTFEIPGCGGLLLSQHSKEQERFFPDGRAAFYFAEAKDACDKIEDILSRSALRSEVITQAHHLVSTHTYTDRATKLLNALS